MPDDRPIEGEDRDPNPESELATPPTLTGDGAPRQHEDDDEGYDAGDDGPVVVSELERAALYEDACAQAEAAGLTAPPTAG